MLDEPLFIADELLGMSSIDSRFELVAGRLMKFPFRAWRCGMVGNNLFTRLSTFVREGNLGVTLPAGTGFLIRQNPDTVFDPDIAFISTQRVSRMQPHAGFWLGAPDLAVEILSPLEKRCDTDERIVEWLARGCAAVWIIDLTVKTVTIHQSPANVQVKTLGEVLLGNPVVPGFSCAVEELFDLGYVE